MLYPDSADPWVAAARISPEGSPEALCIVVCGGVVWWGIVGEKGGEGGTGMAVELLVSINLSAPLSYEGTSPTPFSIARVEQKVSVRTKLQRRAREREWRKERN